MKKGILIGLLASLSLAANAGSLANGSQSSADGIDASVGKALDLSTKTVDMSQNLMEALWLDSKVTDYVSDASRNGSTSVVGENNEKGVRGGIGSVMTSVVGTVVKMEQSTQGSVDYVKFTISDEKGSMYSLTLSYNNSVEASVATKNFVSRFYKNAYADSKALVVASFDASQILLIQAPSESAQEVSQGNLSNASEILVASPSQSATEFSTTLNVKRKEYRKDY